MMATSETHQASPPSVGPFPNLFAFQGVAEAVSAAYKSRLLHALLEGDTAAGDCAERLGLDHEATRLVLDVLTEFGFVKRNRDRYTASAVLTEAEARFGIDMAFAFWDRAQGFLLRGERPGRMDASADERQASYSDVVMSLGKAYTEGARELAGRLGGSPRRILDVGAGSGVWSLAIAKDYPEARITALDFPNVLKTFEKFATELGLADRIATLAGDAHEVQIPASEFDRIIVANVLHLETSEAAAALISRLAGALIAGGEFVVVDSAPGQTRRSKRAFALYLLNRSLRTGGGRPHPPARLKRWLRQAGLELEREIQLTNPPHLRAIAASKPKH